jgi:hypothetical protein
MSRQSGSLPERSATWPILALLLFADLLVNNHLLFPLPSAPIVNVDFRLRSPSHARKNLRLPPPPLLHAEAPNLPPIMPGPLELIIKPLPIMPGPFTSPASAPIPRPARRAPSRFMMWVPKPAPISETGERGAAAVACALFRVQHGVAPAAGAGACALRPAQT